jgi:hypothetical protein
MQQGEDCSKKEAAKDRERNKEHRQLSSTAAIIWRFC